MHARYNLRMDAKPLRGRFSFSLRSLFVGIALLALGPGWWVAHMRNQSDRQLQIVAALDAQIRCVGLVPLFSDRTLSATEQLWWRRLLGNALGSRVDSINFDFKSFDDLSPLAELTDLKSLSLNGTQVSDLAPLSGLKNLEALDLRRTQVTDLAPLAGLSRLQSLYINDTRCDDVAPLASLANLQKLTLTQTQFDDLTPLVHLAELRHLELRAERFSPEQLKVRESLSAALPNCKVYQDLARRLP